MTSCPDSPNQDMTPGQKEVLDFMLRMREQFGDFSFRVVTPRFVAVSPGVDPHVPLGESASIRPRRISLPPSQPGRARDALGRGYVSRG